MIIPVYRGENSISALVDRLVSLKMPGALEVVLVNDASPDNSHKACVEIFKTHPGIVTYIRLARNFGEHNAVLAGLGQATGDYAVIIDDDFQNPPEEITKLIDAAVQGSFDVVYGEYEKKRHAWFRNLGSKFNDKVACWLLGKPRDLYLSSFKCMSRFLVDEVLKYSGPFPYIDGLILRVTRNIGKVIVRHDERKEGRSGYTLKKLYSLWSNMFVNFSVQPLRVATLLGLLFSGLAVAGIFEIIIETIFYPGLTHGIAWLIMAVLLFSGVQLIMLGMIGEYIGKQFLTVNQTPQYVIREMLSDERKA
jgi:undecaprenyl-phosphate 4-deoxy-4-formamido-L-arabinose transferase